MTNESPPRPTEVRQLLTPAAFALADLAAVFEHLQTVLRSCERLMATLASSPGNEPDDLALEAYWMTAVLSYQRCFTAGERGPVLTPDDVTATGLPGDVLGWHRTLGQVQARYVDLAASPRETFSVGVVRDDEGKATGVAVTSARHAMVDEVTVRQTGAVAFELSRMVDARIAELQQKVFAGAGALTSAELDGLPLLDVADA
ncbi:MAG TPA: hypothetical protein VLR26_03955 [Frankiaceae bacterium]|nr:hypothetical protein [Frankiaceae bacterium]